MARTLYGSEEILAKELLALGANDLQIGRRTVSSMGDKELLYKVNLRCRTVLRILKPIYRLKTKDTDTVYKEVKKVKWEKCLSPDKMFAIDSAIYFEDFNHSKSVACCTKDAVVDYFIERLEKHPSVRVNNPDLYISIHISHNDCILSIDSSGESLHKCGYRVDQTETSSNGVLAISMILKTGWKGESDFVGPICGPGTLLIEAAMVALNIAPDIRRREFTFQKWTDYDGELFDRIYNDESGEREFALHYYGSGISQAAIDIALENIRSAGLMKCIDLKMKSFQQYTEAPKPGVLVTNPPYEERISSRDLLGLYNIIGERLKYVFMGYKAWILSYKDGCFSKIGLRPNEKIKLMSGFLGCEYRYYELFEGTNKDFKKALNEDGEERPRESEDSFRRRGNDRQNFRMGRVDHPERRPTATRSEDDEERLASTPGKCIFGKDRGEGRPVHKKFVDVPVHRPIKSRGECPVKMRYRDEGDRRKGFNGHKRDGKRPLSKPTKPIKRRGYGDCKD